MRSHLERSRAALGEGQRACHQGRGELQFRLVMPGHDVASQTYLNNVARFFEGAAAAEDLFSNLKIISRTRTELPSEAHTPSAQIP